MALKVELMLGWHGEPPRRRLFITINGRQALAEGPRLVGHCIYCASQCQGLTTECEQRVWVESTHELKLTSRWMRK